MEPILSVYTRVQSAQRDQLFQAMCLKCQDIILIKIC